MNGHFSIRAITAFAIATAFVHSAIGRAAEPIVTTGIVDAPAAEVWKTWTTKEGWESAIAAHAEIDLRIGGSIRSVYDPKATIGDDSTIENVILSFLPERMISIKVSKPPAKFPYKNAIQKVWTVLQFDPLDEQHTRLTVTMLGYGDDAESL